MSRTNDVGSMAGVKVLELGRLLAAPGCAQVLADLGADVIKVERKGEGDNFRRYGPAFVTPPEGETGSESSGWLSVNRNKRALALDFSDAADLAAVQDLARHCDVFIENFLPGTLTRYGLDYQSLAAVNPGIVYVSITGFGHDGPYADRPGTDGVCQALSGLQSVTGEPHGAPQKVGVMVVDMVTGLNAAIAILAALRARDVQKTGGQFIDMALMDTAMSLMAQKAIDYRLSGEEPRRAGNATYGSAPSNTYRCADGLMFVQAAWDDHFARFCKCIGREDVARDPRFSSWDGRVHNQAALDAIITDEMSKYMVRELEAKFGAAGILHAPVNTIAQALNHPQVKHRGIEIRLTHKWGVEVPSIASPYRLSKTPVTYRLAPPIQNQDGDEARTAWN